MPDILLKLSRLAEVKKWKGVKSNTEMEFSVKVSDKRRAISHYLFLMNITDKNGRKNLIGFCGISLSCCCLHFTLYYIPQNPSILWFLDSLNIWLRMEKEIHCKVQSHLLSCIAKEGHYSYFSVQNSKVFTLCLASGSSLPAVQSQEFFSDKQDLN